MKKLSKLLALLLALALVFSLAACGADDGEKEEADDKGSSNVSEDEKNDKNDKVDVEEEEEEEETDADLIVGEWLCTFDLSDAVSEAMGLDSSVDLPDVAIDTYLTLEFTRTKMTLAMEIDSDSYEDYLSELVDNLIAWALESNDMTMEDLDAEAEAEFGMSAEEYFEELMKDALESVADSMSYEITGYYSIDADEGCVYIAEDKADLDGNADYMEYTLKGDKLTVKGLYDADGEDAGETFESIGMDLPWKFERQ